MILNVASGLALLGVATVVSDLLALYILPQREYYTKKKFEEIDEDEEKRPPAQTETEISVMKNTETTLLLQSNQ